MRLFEYRSPRLHAGLPVEFTVDSTTVRGTCTDVSDKGVRARLFGGLEAGSRGTLSLRDGLRLWTLTASVAYVEAGQTGLAFALDTAEQQELARSFFASFHR